MADAPREGAAVTVDADRKLTTRTSGCFRLICSLSLGRNMSGAGDCGECGPIEPSKKAARIRGRREIELQIQVRQFADFI